MADTSHYNPLQKPVHDGWARFAGILLMIGGIFHVIAGLAALFKDEIFLVGPNSLVILDFTGWGWLHIALGLLIIIIAVSVINGTMFGRIMGIIIASLSAIANFAFLAAYPLWSFLIIAIDVLVIYAILVQGTQVQAARASEDVVTKK